MGTDRRRSTEPPRGFLGFSLSQPLAKGQEEIEHWRERAGWDAPTDGPVHGCAGEGGLAADDGPQDVDQLTVEIVEI